MNSVFLIMIYKVFFRFDFCKYWIKVRISLVCVLFYYVFFKSKLLEL